MRSPDFTDAELLAVEMSLLETLAMLNDHIKASGPDDPENTRRRQVIVRVQSALFKIRYTNLDKM